MRACLEAGVLDSDPAPLTVGILAAELRDVISEGLAPIAMKLLQQDSRNASAVQSRLASAVLLQEMRSLAADALLDRLCDLFDEAAIPFVVIKGPAVARLHPNGWARPYNDIDLLVEPHQFRPAMDLLLRHQFAYPDTSLPPWSWFDRYCREGLNFHGSGDVDLHHHLAPWIFGSSLPSATLIKAADHAVVRGRSVPMASPVHSSIIAVLHILNDLWKGQRGLASWRDLLVIVRHVGPDRVRDAFVANDLGWLLRIAADAMEPLFPGVFSGADPLPRRVPARFVWRLRGLGWDRSTSISRQRLAWAIRLPVPQAAAFMVGSGLPSRQYIRCRHGSYRRYWHQAWSEAMSTFSGADHRATKSPSGDASFR